MIEVLNRNHFLVKEHVGLFKAANNYDIYDPETGDLVLECREERLGFFTRMLRFSKYRTNTPFDIQVRTPDGRQVVRVTRGISLFLSTVRVLDEQDRPIGGFKQKLLSIGGAFKVLDVEDNPICELKGKWHSWEFQFKVDGVELARVTKQWAGMGKELFTSADNYVLSIAESVPREDQIVRQLILAAVLCIDMVLKEH